MKQPKAETRPPPTGSGNPTLAQRYAGLALLLLLGSALGQQNLGGWLALCLLWPAAAAAYLAWGYHHAGARVWGKEPSAAPQAGTNTPSRCWSAILWLRAQRLLMWPLRLGLYAWQSQYWRHDPAPVALAPQLWLGRRLRRREAQRHLPSTVAVLDLAPEYAATWARQQPAHLALAVLDFTSPSPQQLQQGVDFAQRHAQHGVYIHCALGYSRSATMAVAVLLAQHPDWTLSQAITHVQQQRPRTRLLPSQIASLEQWLASSTLAQTRHSAQHKDLTTACRAS